MRTKIVCILLLCACFSLFAQADDTGIAVYLAPVTGHGRDPDDNAFFSGRLAFELVERNYYVKANRYEADYILRGTLAPWQPEKDSPPQSSPEEPLYTFHLRLSDNNSGKNVAEQTLVYSTRDELNALIAVQLSNLFSGIPVGQVNTGAWRNKRLYFGAAAYWVPRVYETKLGRSTSLANYGAGILAEVHFFHVLSLAAGIEASPDWIMASDYAGDNYWDMIMTVPLSLKYVFRPGSHFMIEPYGGIHFNIPAYGSVRPPLLSWRAGLQYGIKAGQGVLFVEPRFSMDIGDAGLDTLAGHIEYRRYSIYLGLGYKYGILNRRR